MKLVSPVILQQLSGPTTTYLSKKVLIENGMSYTYRKYDIIHFYEWYKIDDTSSCIRSKLLAAQLHVSF